MKPLHLICACALFVCSVLGVVHAKEDAKELNLEDGSRPIWQIKSGQDDMSSLSWQPLGHHEFTYWGLSIYKASLWLGTKISSTAKEVSPNGLSRTDWGLPRGVIALSLVYQRGFSKELLVKRSMEEMLAQHSVPQGQKVAWERELRAVLPSVNEQDELVALYDAQDLGRVLFLGKLKGRLSYESLGCLSAPLLAQSFMGIWLSPQTSQPKMREALLSQMQNKLEAKD